MHLAAREGHLLVVKYLIARGANIEAQDLQGVTALHYAAKNNHLQIVQYLVDHGAKPEVKNSLGNNAIDYAKMNHHLKVAQYMQGHGPKTQAFITSGVPGAVDSTKLILTVMTSFSLLLIY